MCIINLIVTYKATIAQCTFMDRISSVKHT